MPSNLPEFLKELKEQEKYILDEIQRIEKEVVLDIHKALLQPKSVGGTPRLTGWLASNWIITLEIPSSSVVGSRDAVGPAFNAQDRTTIAFRNSNLLDTRMIYINNLVSYGPVVNERYGFRESSIKRGIATLAKERVIK